MQEKNNHFIIQPRFPVGFIQLAEAGEGHIQFGFLLQHGFPFPLLGLPLGLEAALLGLLRLSRYRISTRNSA